jgi:hypothetical protein
VLAEAQDLLRGNLRLTLVSGNVSNICFADEPFFAGYASAIKIYLIFMHEVYINLAIKLTHNSFPRSS